MYCIKCGDPTTGDNFICDDCRPENTCDECGETYSDCTCHDGTEMEECEECGLQYNNHKIGCPNNLSGFNELYINGFD